MDNNYLAHFGILGMKWGERRFQNPDGSLTTLGRLRYGVGKGKDGSRVVINKKHNKAITDKEDDKKTEVESEEEIKARVIKSGNAAEILKYQDKLTDQELQTAVNRVRSISTLTQQSDYDISRADRLAADAKARKYNNNPVVKFSKAMDTITNFSMGAVNTAIKFKDVAKKVKKLMYGDDDKKIDVSKMDLNDPYAWVRKNIKDPKDSENITKYLTLIEKAEKYKANKTNVGQKSDDDPFDEKDPLGWMKRHAKNSKDAADANAYYAEIQKMRATLDAERDEKKAELRRRMAQQKLDAAAQQKEREKREQEAREEHERRRKEAQEKLDRYEREEAARKANPVYANTKTDLHSVFSTWEKENKAKRDDESWSNMRSVWNNWASIDKEEEEMRRYSSKPANNSAMQSIGMQYLSRLGF